MTSEQLGVVTHAHRPVALLDEQGNLRGYVALVVTEDELLDAQRALAFQQKRYTTEEVLSALHSRAKP